MVSAAALATLYSSLFVVALGKYEISNYIVFPDDNGLLYMVDLDEPPLTDVETQYFTRNVDKVTFTLFTSNPGDGEILKPQDTKSLKNSHWNPANPTRFVTHGWRSSGNSVSCTWIRNAYLATGEYNIIVIDWSAIANSILLSYGKVARSVPIVAEYVATFIEFLETYGDLDYSSTKMIGHSLGAHLVSLAARHSIRGSAKVYEVVGLDPAKPLFEGKNPGGRIDATDAEYVQIIHTSSGKLGISIAVGTADFYPNDGSRQPGCTLTTDVFDSCSHSRSYEYFAESIRNPTGFLAVSTKRYESGLEGRSAYMGGAILDHKAKGSYVLKTNDKPPYALG